MSMFGGGAQWFKAAMSPLVKRLLSEGHRPVRKADGSIQIGSHRFVTVRRPK